MKAVVGISARQRAGVFFLIFAILSVVFYEEESEAARRGRGGRGVRRGGAAKVQARGGQRRGGGRRQARRGGGRRGRNLVAVNNGLANNNNLNFGVGGLNDLALAGRGGFDAFGIGGANRFNQFGINDQVAVLNDPFNRGGFGNNQIASLGNQIGGLPSGFSQFIGPGGVPVANVFQSPQGLVEALPGAFANGQVANPQAIQALVTAPDGKIFAGQARKLSTSTLTAVQNLNGQGENLDAFGAPRENDSSRAPAEVAPGRPLAQ